MRLARRLAATAALALAALPLGAQRGGEIPPLHLDVREEGAPPPAADTAGLRFRLSDAPGGREVRVPLAPATMLAQADAARVLARLPALAPTAAPDSFAFPARTLPPPRAGRVVHAAFPPPDSLRPPPAAGPRAPLPLAVVRGAPTGEVTVGAEVTVAFSQPVVPLSSVGQTETRELPVRLSPAPAGAWRWLDVRTLVFTPAGRMPAATEYTVRIPAGTRSAAGTTLAEGAEWTFRTPPPTATGAHPYGTGIARDGLLLLRFDQRVDAAALAGLVRVSAGGRDVAVRAATPAEVEGDPAARALARQAEAGTWAALRPAAPLPYDAEVRVTIPPGRFSAEGPLPTVRPQSWSFRTYGPLRALTAPCERRDRCRPGTPLVLPFSNPLDTAAFDAAWVSVRPAISGMRVAARGNAIVVAGRTAPNTRYTVQVEAPLRDVHRQTLGATVTRELHVGAPFPGLTGLGERMIVLDPVAPRRLSVVSHDHARLRLRIHRVEPRDWPAFHPYRRARGEPAALPGTPVVDRVLTVGAAAGEERETAIDLDEVLRGAPGQLVVAVEGMDGEGDRQGTYAWVQATRIGLSAFADADSLRAWATSLVSGAPVAGARVELAGGRPAAADADGLAVLPLPGAPGTPYLVATLGDDRAILPGGWVARGAERSLLWYGITDRNLYRPGEEVRFKGWVRRLHRTPDGGLHPAPGTAVAWTVRDPRGAEIATDTAVLTALGGFDGAFRVPEGANLGPAAVELRLVREGVHAEPGHVAFAVQEFRRPEFEVAAEADPGPHVVGGSAEVSVRATYFAGGALPGAPVTWRVRSSPASFTPPGWGSWRFGMDPWAWWDAAPPSPTFAREHAGETDAAGRHTLRLDFDEALPPRAHTLEATATLADVNRQSWTTTTALLVHPASVYAGMRTERGWVRAGEPIELSLIVSDLEGRLVAGTPIHAIARRLAWRAGPRGWGQVPVDSTACAAVSAEAPVSCTFPTHPEGGAYQVEARVRDAAGRPSVTQVTVWAAGGSPWRMGGGSQANEQRAVTLVPDRDRYAPGDTARILAQLPFWPARGVVTVRREGVVRIEALASDGPTATFTVPIGEADVPGVWVQLDLVGAHDAGGAPRPTARGTDQASGGVRLAVPPGHRTLTVRAIAADTVALPDGRTEIAVEVVDAGGRPVAGAEVALAVVDEAVLALTGYRFADPLALFHPDWHPGVGDHHLRPHVRVLADTSGGPGVVRGRVEDARTGRPLAGAEVQVVGAGLSAVTDAAGHFRIAAVPTGRWTLRVTHAAHAGEERAVEVGGAALPMLRISLGPSAEAVLQGRVSGLALEGVTVTAAAAEDFSGVGREGGAAVRARGANAPPAPPPAPAAPPPVAAGFQTGVSPEEGAAPIALRADFSALALWAPVVRTGADGRARVPVDLPSSLTRYRVMAVAASETRHFGGGESSLTVRQPLSVRPSAPRFLNHGDRFELAVVVQNLGAVPLEVQVAARGDGVAFTEPGKRVTVPAGDRVEVRIAAEAVRAGPARIQIAATAGGLADAAEIALPVYTPATAEAFATYGSLAEEGTAELPLHVPEDAIPAYGGLEVSTSTTALHELTDAYLYLVGYPFDCAEQIASRLLAVAALRDVLAEFRAEGLPPAAEVDGAVRHDVGLLAERQSADGGFGFWHARQASHPYVSVHALHALVRTRARGHAVPEAMYGRAMAYAREVDRHVPRDWPASARLAVRAYAAYVRDLAADEGVDGELRALLPRARADTVPLEVAGWLLAAAADRPAFAAERTELLRRLANRATETASTATFATRYEEGEYLLLHSERRTDAVVLEALLRADPGTELATKTVRGLLGHRTRGRWSNTQENAWVLLALDRYFRVYEDQTPELLAGVWLGGRLAGEHRFAGRTADRHHLEVPMAYLAERRPETVTIGREGTGRLYYRAALRYAPRDLDLTPLDRGFAVERTYEAVDDPADVTRGEDGRWRVRAGARVRVTVTMAAPSRRVHVALVDPLPAGFEALNPALRGADPGARPGVTGPAGAGRWGWGPWFEHQNLRDERAEAFTSLLPAGVYTYSYVARATTPGLFVVPPPRAEEMYSPETFGRGATDRVLVAER